MKKTLYSLMLSDDVVRAVDELAHRMGTNRSALVNQILAEYTDMVTPERQVQDIFRQIGEILGADRDLVPFVAPNAMFRTQSQELLDAMGRFFRLWKDVEDELVAAYHTAPVEYALYPGRFTRTLDLPARRDYSSADVAGAISEYVRLFDRLMKGVLAGGLTARDVEAEYIRWLRAGNIIL